MSHSKKYILLGTVCLAAALLQSALGGTFSAAVVFVPYLTFCLCAFIVGGRSRSVRGAVTVLSLGLLLLPILDNVYSTVTVWLGMFLPSLFTKSLAVNAVVVFVQALIYLLALLFVNGRMSWEKKRFPAVWYIVPVLLAVGYSVLEGIQARAMAEAITMEVAKMMAESLGSTEAESLFPMLSAAHETAYLGVIAQILLYSAFWYISAGFVKKGNSLLRTE